MRRIDRIILVWIAIALRMIAFRSTPTLNAGSSFHEAKIISIGGLINNLLPVRLK